MRSSTRVGRLPWTVKCWNAGHLPSRGHCPGPGDRRLWGRDAPFAAIIVEAALTDPDLAPALPYFQTHAGLDALGLERLQRATRRSGARAFDFACLGTGVVAQCPAPALIALLGDIAQLLDGPTVALDILEMGFYRAKDEPALLSEDLIRCGRTQSRNLSFDKPALARDHGIAGLMTAACRAKRRDGSSSSERPWRSHTNWR